MTVDQLIDALFAFRREHPNCNPIVRMDGTFEEVSLLIPTNAEEQGPETNADDVVGLQLASYP